MEYCCLYNSQLNCGKAMQICLRVRGFYVCLRIFSVLFYLLVSEVIMHIIAHYTALNGGGWQRS